MLSHSPQSLISELVGSLLFGQCRHGVSAMSACGLCVLTTHTNVPIVTETTVVTHALHPLNVFPETLVQEVGVLLAGFSIFDVPLPVQHPGWDLELKWVADDRD